MKRTILALAFLGLLATPAMASWPMDVGDGVQVATHHKAYRQTRHGRHGASYAGWANCALAARMGGPCGCVAMAMTGLTDRRYWLVANWRRFPRTDAHVGAAALWGNRHVEIVTAVHSDGTVDTRGSVGFRHVPVGRLTFVDVR